MNWPEISDRRWGSSFEAAWIEAWLGHSPDIDDGLELTASYPTYSLASSPGPSTLSCRWLGRKGTTGGWTPYRTHLIPLLDPDRAGSSFVAIEPTTNWPSTMAHLFLSSWAFFSIFVSRPFTSPGVSCFFKQTSPFGSSAKKDPWPLI